MTETVNQTPLEWAIRQLMASDASYDDLYAEHAELQKVVVERSAELETTRADRDAARARIGELFAENNRHTEQRIRLDKGFRLCEEQRDEVRATAALQKGLIEKLNQQIASLEAVISCSQHNESLFRKRQDDLEQENTALRRENEELITQLENTRNTPDIRPFGPEIPAKTNARTRSGGCEPCA